MLFLLNGVSKLADGGRMAIIQNGSSLFTGDAGSGPSEIRRYLIENDWLDAIIQLPNDSFYNTGIATYIWIVTKDKPASHEGRLLLIDASNCYEPRRKSIGNKRVDISAGLPGADRQGLWGIYQQGLCGNVEQRAGDRLQKPDSRQRGSGLQQDHRRESELDEHGNKVLKKGKPVADSGRRDTENVPLDRDVEEYLRTEVRPYNPDAWIDQSKTRVGYEIPFTRTFYVYKKLDKADDIADRIEKHERALMKKLHALFGKEQ